VHVQKEHLAYARVNFIIKQLDDIPPTIRDANFLDKIWLRKTNDPKWRISALKGFLSNRSLYKVNEREAVISITRENNEIVLYTSDSMFCETLVYRELYIHIIISLIVKYSEANGALLLHAAAVSVKNNSCLIVGEGGSGKTTTLLTSMKSEGVNCISNDKCLLFPEESNTIYGIPNTINIRNESILSFPELNLTPSLGQRKVLVPHKSIISSNIQSGTVKCIAFPKCNLPERTTCDSISSDRAFSKMLSQCESYENNDKFTNWHEFFTRPVFFDSAYRESVILNLCSCAPSYILNWGYDFEYIYNRLPFTRVLNLK
jgi:hypothetical protein